MGGKSRAGAVRASVKQSPLVLALPKGRILKEAVDLFTKAGYDLRPALKPARKLVIDCGPLQVWILRSSDVPTYVHHGAADLGVVGSDVLIEANVPLYEPLDLRIGRCQMVVAEPENSTVDENAHAHLRIASKYPIITKRYLAERGLTAEVIKLGGSVELGPLTGLSDRIVDITETGETLRQNGLRIVESILEISTRLVVNPASLKLRSGEISRLIERLRRRVV